MQGRRILRPCLISDLWGGVCVEDQAVKEKRNRKPARGWVKILLTVVVTVIVFSGILCITLGRSGIALLESWFLARYAFVDTEADLDAAADQALYGLVAGLKDRWSYYLSEEDYQRVRENRANNYVGIGVTVNYEHEEGLFVQAVTAGGPAEKAGIRIGDIIVAVEGVSVAGDARHSATDLIRGEPGTKVTLTLLGEDGTTRDVVCTRKYLNNPSASGTMLEGNIGYVYLANFYSGSAESFRQEVDRLQIEGAESLIVDLRNCPGGYVNELKKILDYLLPEGPVFTEKSRWWFKSVYESDEACVDLPMVAIVNTETYSAAELLAAQLRESVSAPVVGELTSGKGYVQITFPLVNGGGIGISTATYCTGSGHSLIGEGIVPDVAVKLETGADEQLQAAIGLLIK